MTGRAVAAFRARCGRLRQFAICILLLAISALVLQAPVHASPAGHAIHQQQAAAMASHCARHHMSGDHGADPSGGCVSDDTGLSLVNCCQTCLIAAIPVDLPALGTSPEGEVPIGLRSDFYGRSPEGILRPPRLIAV